jgi:glycosyltransferase involved in cell wall biosynthesis
MVAVPKVSVLIPTYNYARFLPDAIESVLNQTFTDFELIIVDNDSSDETDNVVNRYITDKRVRYYKNYIRGMASNWNQCIDYARGTYLKMLCGDDKFHPHLLEKFVAIMERYPQVSVVTSFRGVFGRPENARDGRAFEICQEHQHLTKGHKVIKHTLQTFNWIGEPTAVMIRKANLHLGYFRTDMEWMADWEMWLRHLTVGDCYLIPEILSYIRKHNGSMTTTICKKAYFNYFEDYNFYKSLNNTHKYAFGLSPSEREDLIKKGARNCAKAMLKSIPKLHQKSFRNVFVKGLKIGFTEKVLTDTIFELSRNSIKRIGANELLHLE